MNCIHSWLRIGGSRKERYFWCPWCDAVFVKRLGTDVRWLRAGGNPVLDEVGYGLPPAAQVGILRRVVALSEKLRSAQRGFSGECKSGLVLMGWPSPRRGSDFP